MRYRIIAILFFVLFIFLLTFFAIRNIDINISPVSQQIGEEKEANPLSIDYLKRQNYPGSEIKIESELENGSNYKRFIASYRSDGLKIYGLLTVPDREKPEKGFPAIIFAHGYIPPEEYRSDERYVAYVNALSEAGFVVFKIDFRGNGNSEGSPTGAYFSPGYTVDTLNAISSIKKFPNVNSEKIGAWGHSMSGMILTRALAIDNDSLKAVSLWAPVVGSYEDIFKYWWNNRVRPTFTPSQRELNANRPTRQKLISQYGEPDEKSEFWRSISPKTYLNDFNIPIQLHHGTEDQTVPFILSENFNKALTSASKNSELFIYDGADHNLSSPAFEPAMERTIEFFNKYLK